LIADRQGKGYLDTAAVQVAGGIVAKVEDEGIARAIGDTDDVAQVGITTAEVPLTGACAFRPVDPADIEQWQGQINGEFELLIIPGDQIVTELEGDIIARMKFDGAPRMTAAIDIGEVDGDLAGGDTGGGLGAVRLATTGQVDIALYYGGGGV
jgi:hypothetical protein